jgi:hypothetical protein
VAQPAWGRLMRSLAAVASHARGLQPWFIEAHQFRIDTTDGIGRPTPEGAHRDGVDLVAVFLVARHGIKGGETRVFEADGPNGQRFTLTQPWSLVLLDDTRVIHESTPIQPLGEGGWRDTLVVTLRAGGFQDDGASAADAAAAAQGGRLSRRSRLRGAGASDAFEDGGDALAAADAHRDERIAAVDALQLVQRLHRDQRTGRTDGVAQRDA